ncbi:hypothetical protein [Acetobacter sicerae]|nr:hypothetical protein [Acetobacter sicerae]NHN93447.1 hypothetical protein [Acetobacter sicerae]
MATYINTPKPFSCVDEASIRALLKPKAPTHDKDMKPVVQARVRELEAA